MCVATARGRLIATAKAEIGYREGANNWNKYASDPDIERLYGWIPQNQPWCCTFVNWCFLNTFGYDIGSRLTYGGTAACNNSAQLFKSHNAFTAIPEVGDQVFFYSGGGINHTGIVAAVDGGTIQTIEGNYSDSVGTAYYSISSSKIAGYGRPCWNIVDGKEEPAKKEDEIDHSWTPKTIGQSNAYSSDCVVLQALLNAHHFAVGEVDGLFGAKTQAAVNACQRYYQIPITGTATKQTWAVLLNEGNNT